MLAKDAVAARYAETISAQATSPDKITYTGDDLVGLDPNLVILSPSEHPRSFSNGKKWVITMILGAYCFLAPFTSTIFAPALQSVLADLHEDDPMLGALQIAIFLLAFAIAPLFLAPLSETYGRSIVIRGGNIFFVIFCLGGGFAKTTAQLAVCRFLCGVGGSASLAAFGGVLSDVWGLADRAKANAILGTGLLLGPVMGPVCGGWMSEAASWRWACWVPAIAGAVLEIITTLFFKETHIPVLLKRKVAKLLPPYYTVLGFEGDTTSLLRASARPLTYLLLDPAMSVLAFYFAFAFGVQYLVIVTFQRVFGEGYGHSVGIVGTDLTAEGIGALLGMILSTYVANWIYKYKKRHDPESSYPDTFYRASDWNIFSAGSTNSIISIQMYVIDGFDYPASAIAGLSVLRCLFAAVFPLFGNQLFTTLGIDWGIGLLAFLSLGIGAPVLPLVYRYGFKLREVGKRNRERLSL